MPLVLPGADVSKVFTGSDSLATVQNGLSTEPQAGSPPDGSLSWLEAHGIGIGSESAARAKAASEQGKTSLPGFDFKTLLYPALFVVIGLLVISRGFGMIGEEGTDVLVNLENPQKFPGVGHAIQGIKNRKRKTQ